MRILQIDIHGFRSLREISWKPGFLNVIIGPNGTGKSNLLRFLELLSVSAQGNLGKYIQASGGIDPLIWDGSSSNISSNLKTSPIEETRDLQRDSLTYELEIARVGKGGLFRVQRELLANYYRVEQEGKPEPFKFIERKGLNAKIFDQQERSLVAQGDAVAEDETILSVASGPFTANQIIAQFQQSLSSWAIYHDVDVHKDAPIRQPVVTRLERRVDPDGQNLIAVLHTLYSEDREFKLEVNTAMRAAFGDDFEELVFPPAADQKVQLRVRWKSLRREQSMADLSDGTLRFLFLLAVLASPIPPPVIAIDEPETGLHPTMMSIVAEYAVEASRKSQIILTTHSPEFLDAFKGARPTTTVAKWSGGETTLTTVAGEDLEYWLREYSLGSLFRSGELESAG